MAARRSVMKGIMAKANHQSKIMQRRRQPWQRQRHNKWHEAPQPSGSSLKLMKTEKWQLWHI